MKADGTSEFFKVEKLRRSLRRSGAENSDISRIITTLTGELFDGITTQAIYRRAFSLLRSHENTGVAARYSLRRALFNLGPTGFPFEKFLGRLFETQGYTTKTGIILPGKCAPHEIDVAAYSDTHSFVAEAKFHARPGIKTDLQVVLYSYARLLDLKGQRICNEDHCGVKEFWVITNTKFTSTAQKYATCAGLRLLSWDYPRHDNLHDLIQRSGIYPITVLSSLSTAHAATLMARGVLLCRDLLGDTASLRTLHLSPQKQEIILKEAGSLCGA